MYQLRKDKEGNLLNVILRISDQAFIPMYDDNPEYQTYLKWLAEGNTPEPADEPEGE
jgi:hypothetical protein